MNIYVRNFSTIIMTIAEIMTVAINAMVKNNNILSLKYCILIFLVLWIQPHWLYHQLPLIH